MSGGPGFDWPGLMRLGLGRLGLRPAEFWALTPVELLMMLGHGPQVGPLDAAGLEALAARFPDRVKGQGDERDPERGRGAGGGS